MKYQINHIPVNGYARSGKKLTGVKKLVLHWTANFGSGADNHRRYFSSLKDRYASAHIFVDKDVAIEIIPLTEVAYHANDVQKRVNGVAYRGVAALKPNANFLSIGVEMCVEKDGSFHADTVTQTVEVFAKLCKQFNLDPINDIVRHYDITAKDCPSPWVKNTPLFDAFKKRVQAELNGTKTVSSTPVQKPNTSSVSGKIAVVLVDVLNVRNAPNGKVVSQAKKGEAFTVVSQTGDWFKLKSGLYISANSKYVKLK